MADWFKFYNDGLDSKGMQFAISEQPLVTSVWLVIMSEASKNRSSKIKWADEDFELIGLARKINISVPVFNQSIGLLERIKYITKKDGLIIIHGWESLQSDYAKGLDKGYYKNTRKSLGSKKEVSTARREEKRGEEKRVEGNGAPTPELPTEQEAIAQTMSAGIPEAFTKYVYADWFSRQGKDAGGVEVKFLGYVTKRWAREQVEWKSKTHKGTKDANNPKSNTNRIDRSIGTSNEGRAAEYEGLGRVVKAQNP